jgi:hypothetical protein
MSLSFVSNTTDQKRLTGRRQGFENVGSTCTPEIDQSHDLRASTMQHVRAYISFITAGLTVVQLQCLTTLAILRTAMLNIIKYTCMYEYALLGNTFSHPYYFSLIRIYLPLKYI